MMVERIQSYDALKKVLLKMCAEIYREEDPEEAVFQGKLVVSELVANALRYGGGEAVLSVRRENAEIRVAVKSKNSFRPPETSRCSSVDEEKGRGLFLVDSFALSRGYSEEEGVCVVLRIEK